MATHEIDLRRAADELGRKGQYRPFANAVDRLHATLSARKDLNTAAECLAELKEKHIVMRESVASEIDRRSAEVGASLFFRAVLMYVRATITTNGSRVGSGIADKIDSAFKALHSQAKELRNDALAHLSGGGRGWQVETLVLRHLPHGSEVIHTYSIHNFRGLEVIEYAGLVDHALSVADIVVNQRSADLDRIAVGLADDAYFQERVGRAAFDPAAFFPTPEARAIWEASRSNQQVPGVTEMHAMVPRGVMELP